MTGIKVKIVTGIVLILIILMSANISLGRVDPAEILAQNNPEIWDNIWNKEVALKSKPYSGIISYLEYYTNKDSYCFGETVYFVVKNNGTFYARSMSEGSVIDANTGESVYTPAQNLTYLVDIPPGGVYIWGWNQIRNDDSYANPGIYYGEMNFLKTENFELTGLPCECPPEGCPE